MKERGDGSVTLGNQCPVAVASFLDFAYSGETLITDGNVDTLFQLASFLQVSVLSRACSDFLIGTLEVGNCLSLSSLAEAFGSASLLQSANHFVVRNFYDLSKTRDFLDMQVGVLEACLSSDALSVPHEEVVVMSLLRWTRHDLPGRQKLFPGLLSLTRLHHVPAPVLKTLRDSEVLLQDGRSCLALLSLAESRQRQDGGLLCDARPATARSYIYISKTEEDGETRHAFCYCLESDRWKELGAEPGEEGGGPAPPDPPGSCLTSFAEKVRFGSRSLGGSFLPQGVSFESELEC
ncbi:Kelch repeat and BTB domain-containing protein 3 [Liparis tanakae]|uniref:Kelch repeat and BTB domain-containing protein 3 n=1 Tax=Liparis tanakae TaxID=230148 RepID=A0A4Z2EEU2_9TELE|nr:Kelch repeat and BTB domain-containing protein 3 [Liparis tanakae]